MILLISSSAIAKFKYPSTRSKEVKTLQLCTAYNVSSMWDKGNASLIVTEFSFQVFHRETNLPRIFMANDNLRGIETMRWVNDPLVQPGAEAFIHLSLKLPQNCPVWKMHMFISADQNSRS